jgi:hypothetical protein
MESKPSQLRRRRVIVLALASIALGGGFFWLLNAGGLPIVPSSEVIWRLGLDGVLIYSLLWLVTVFFKSARWYFQLAPIADVPLIRVFSASLVGYAAQLILPLKTGEFARPALISRGTNVSFFAAVSTSAAERILDALFGSVLLISCLLSARVLDPLPDRIGELPVPAKLVPTLGYSFAGMAIIAVLVVSVFYWKRTASQRVIHATLGKVSPRFGQVVQQKLGELADGLSLLSSAKLSLRYTLVTAIYWASYVFGIWYLFRASGFREFSFAQAGVVTGTLAFSFSMPNAPGYFGVFQVSIYAALAMYYSPEVVQDLGATAVFWTYVLQLGWSIALAPVAAYVEQRHVRSSLAVART